MLSSPRLPATITVCVALLLGAAGCGLPEAIEARRIAREGNDRYADGDYQGAIERYLAAERIDPETPNLYLNLGYAYFSIFKPEDARGDRGIRYAQHAIDAFEQHLRRNPADEVARVFEAKILLKAAPYDAAIAARAQETFLALLRKNPDDVEARQNLISLFLDCQRYDEAVRFFAPRLEKDPADAESMKILAIIAERCKRTDDAVRWYLRRAEAAAQPGRQAEYYYEVGTYVWGLLHYHPDRVAAEAAPALIETGLAATRKATALRKDYAEALVYTNLLLLKRVPYQPTEELKYQDQMEALRLRTEAERILRQRKRDQGLPVAEEDAGADAGAGGR